MQQHNYATLNVGICALACWSHIIVKHASSNVTAVTVSQQMQLSPVCVHCRLTGKIAWNNFYK